MIKKTFKIAISIFLYTLLVFPSSTVSATLSNETLNFMGINGINYYNPEGDCISNDGYAGIVSGGNNEAKIWNYFVSAGINGISNNPAAIAGIMGNLMAESGYNPFAVSRSGTYYGLYQTNSSSMIAAVNTLGNYWKSTNAPEDVNDSAIEIELDYLINDKFVSEKRFKTYVNSALNNNISNSANGAEIYAELFMVAVERAVGGTEPLTSTEAKNLSNSLGLNQYTNRGWQHTSRRRNYAAEVYNKYANTTSTPTVDIISNICYTNNSPYTSDGIPQYFQCGESWSNLMYGPGGIHGTQGTNICTSGCGPTSFAMMATALLGRNILPDEVADIAGKKGQHAYAGGWVGSSWTITQVLANHYGLQYKAINTCDINTINRYLQDGWMIHTSGEGSAPFTQGGHYIGIAGINSSGEWYVANSAGRNNANRYYSPSVVVSAGMKCGNVKAIKR